MSELSFISFDSITGKRCKDTNLYTSKQSNLANYPPHPWQEEANTESPPLVRLHNEIIKFCQFVYPLKSEIVSREKVVQDINNIALSLWDDCELQLFGSQSTRILTSCSDIDIAFVNVPTRENTLNCTKSDVDRLFELGNKIKSTGLVSYLEVISNAKVPIIKMDHISSGLSVDICINNETGQETGQFVAQAIQQYPALRPLTIVLKIFLV